MSLLFANIGYLFANTFLAGCIVVTAETNQLIDRPPFYRASRADSGSVDLETPLELSPKSPLEVLDEALDRVMPSTFSLPVAPPRGKIKKGDTVLSEPSPV
jgi:hypothetical protein